MTSALRVGDTHSLPKNSKRTISKHQLLQAIKIEDTSNKLQLMSLDNTSPLNSNAPGSALFSTVGGNIKAKTALVDALALNPIMRLRLARFGLSPPSGVLLYGPPGEFLVS
uniref:Uncharacterized protein n=1 Tax=Proboscia inermis TaxID=420281 RepID=A0A7S0CAB0_9STRA